MDTPNDFLPVNELAAGSGLTRERLIRLVQSGVIEGVFDRSRSCSGGRWFASRAAVERYLRQSLRGLVQPKAMARSGHG